MCVQVEKHSKFTANKCKNGNLNALVHINVFRGHATKVLAKASTHMNGLFPLFLMQKNEQMYTLW